MDSNDHKNLKESSMEQYQFKCEENNTNQTSNIHILHSDCRNSCFFIHIFGLFTFQSLLHIQKPQMGVDEWIIKSFCISYRP